MLNELVDNLGSDIQFYQSFKLTEDELLIVSTKNRILIDFYNKPINRSHIKLEFLSLIEDISCEKFIAIGHLLDIMFSMNQENAKSIREYLIFLFNENVIDKDDIKHGMVLGLVNFRDNIVNYPSSKTYLKEFLALMTELEIIDDNLKIVFEKCCDNIEKLIF